MSASFSFSGYTWDLRMLLARSTTSTRPSLLPATITARRGASSLVTSMQAAHIYPPKSTASSPWWPTRRLHGYWIKIHTRTWKWRARMTGDGDQCSEVTWLSQVCAAYRIVAHRSIVPVVDVKTAKVFLFDEAYSLTEEQVITSSGWPHRH